MHEAMRYVVRLVHDLATQGAYDRALELPGLHADEGVVVTPIPEEGKVNARLVLSCLVKRPRLDGEKDG